ncbi:MAG TPA: hypothetical protein VNQ99_16905 [Xanthobacteraceae bacterium]|nr:hypothetical protein [Xanthobacteraceae bacterium]
MIRISIDLGFQFSGLYSSVLVPVGFDGWRNILSAGLAISVARVLFQYHLPVPRTDNHHPPRASGDAFPSNGNFAADGRSKCSRRKLWLIQRLATAQAHHCAMDMPCSRCNESLIVPGESIACVNPLALFVPTHLRAR